MPVDFSLLPPAEEVPNNPPSRFIWTVVFVVLTLFGVFAVLMFWPKGEPTQTLWFWVCVTVYPLGIATFVVLRRYSVYEGRRLDALAWNRVREQHIQQVFDAASSPLGVLASTYRYSADRDENALEGLLSGALTLKTRQLPTPDTAPMKTRWLAPVTGVQNVNPASDQERQAQLMTWLFTHLLTDVADAICGLPSAVRLTVHLNFCGSAMPANAIEKWQSCWKELKLPGSVAVKEISVTGLMLLDTWLDNADVHDGQEARLMVFTQLNDLVNNAPPVDSAEAGVALLLVPVALAKQYQLPIVAQVHRPIQGKFDAIHHILEYALRWGKVALCDVARTWQTGFDVDRSGVLTTSMVKADVQMSFSDLDKRVGKAGNAAPWLALACAVEAAQTESAKQLVANSTQDNLQLAVVAKRLSETKP